MSSKHTVRIDNLGSELTPIAVAIKTVTVSTTAGTLPTLGSFTLHADTRQVTCAVKSYPVNIDPSGNNPTSSVGIPVVAGQIITMSCSEFLKAKWIRSGASDATVDVAQYSY